MTGIHRVANARQHVGDGITHHLFEPSSLPARLGYARQFAQQGQLAHAQAAHFKLADISARTATPPAPIPVTNLKLQLLALSRHLGLGGHNSP
jgi:hypothetical protein